MGVLANMLAAELRKRDRLALMFVCTHNARRSQVSQAWSHAMTSALHLPISVCSGGSEPFMVHPSAFAAVQAGGFPLLETADGSRKWRAEIGFGQPPLELWSKRWNDRQNPQTGFVTIANCAAAEESCPTIPGGITRLALLYEDPGRADGTEQEAEIYRATSERIGTELWWLFRTIAAARASS